MTSPPSVHVAGASILHVGRSVRQLFFNQARKVQPATSWVHSEASIGSLACSVDAHAIVFDYVVRLVLSDMLGLPLIRIVLQPRREG